MSSHFKKLVLPIGLSIFGLTCSILGFTGALSQRRGGHTHTDWMSQLPGNYAIRNIAMPGSHDTMALYSIGDLSGQCQSLTLEDQLNVGVRFLDIRLKLDHNELKAVHGIVDEKATFRDICGTVESFLTAHSGEYIIMSIKEEAGASSSTIGFEEALLKYLDKDVYLKDREIPERLEDVRGKVSILSRYPNSTIGIEAYNEWKDSCSFVMESNDIYVQDTYKIKTIDEKKNEVVSCLNTQGHALKINFLSAYKTSGFPPTYAPSAAKEVNSWINNVISKYSDVGIVLYDFVTSAHMDVFFEGGKYL